MSIINSVKTQAVTAAASYGLKKVSGIMRKTLGLGDKAKTGGVLPTGSASYGKPTNIFSFPLDVTAGPGLGNQGHYVMFYINEQQSAELKFGGASGKNGETSVMQSKKEANIPEYIKRMGIGGGSTIKESFNGYESQLNSAIGKGGGADFGSISSAKSKLAKRSKGTYGGGSTAYVKRAPTVRLDTAIALYMPPSATFTSAANYQDTEIGVGAKMVGDAYNSIKGGASMSGVISQTLDTLGSEANASIVNKMLGLVSAVGPGFQGSKEAFEMASGEIVADRMELAFKGINKRKFQFAFKFIPKNKKEADEVRNIIFAFRSNMAPEFVGGARAGRKMRVPNTFDISYMYDGNENQYLQKISTCVLEQCDVVYGGDRYRTFEANEEGAPAVETQVTLQFGEMELITKERINEGF